MNTVQMLIMAVQGLSAVAMVLCGFVMKRLWKELDELRESETQTRAEINQVNLQVARDYPTRADLHRLELVMADGFKKVSQDTEKLFDRLDKKVDKHGP